MEHIEPYSELPAVIMCNTHRVNYEEFDFCTPLICTPYIFRWSAVFITLWYPLGSDEQYIGDYIILN